MQPIAYSRHGRYATSRGDQDVTLPVRITRRTLLVGTCALAVLASFGMPVARADEYVPLADEYADLRARYRAIIAGPPDFNANDPEIKNQIDELNAPVPDLLSSVDTAADRQRVFTNVDLLTVGGTPIADNVTTTLTNLQTLAVAYATPGGEYTGSTDVARVLIEGLQTTHDLAYNAATVENGDDWYAWEIASNGRVGRILTLLYEDVPEQLRLDLLAAIDHFVPDPGYLYPASDPRHKASTGSNRVDLCLYVAARGILGSNAERIAIARDRVGDAFGYAHYDPATDAVNDSNKRDGIYPDGSYIQHYAVAYTGDYGITMLSSTAQILALLSGSTWKVTDARVANVIDAVRTAFVPWIFNGAMMSSVRGRAVARQAATDHSVGRAAIPRILLFANGVDAATAADWRGRARGWLERDQTHTPAETDNLPGLLLIKDLLSSSVRPIAEPNEHAVFPKMDRAVFRRPGWALAVSMSSSRIARFEVMSNGENKRGWHQGSGATYLYLDGDPDGQFTDGYWPTVDPYRLPGTTVDSRRLPDVTGGSIAGTMIGYGVLTGGSLVGGDLDAGAYRGARFAAVVHHERGYINAAEKPPPAPFYARMSWFALEHGIVFLGAGISGGSGAPIETIVENRRVPVDGDDRWYVNGVEVAGSGTPGWSASLAGVKYLALPGTAGYVFLDGPRTVQAKRENRTGSWADVRSGGDQTPITRGYLTAWLDHGTAPDNASYAWLLVPNASVADSQTLSADPGVEVISNTAAVQAVTVPKSGYTGANFFGAGSVSHGHLTITVDRMSSVSALIALPNSGAHSEISVADPTQLASAVTLAVELPPGRPWKVIGSDPSVTARLSGTTLTIRADVAAHDGLVRRTLLQG